MISSPRYLRTGFFISVPVPFITRSILILAPQDVFTVKSTQGHTIKIIVMLTEHLWV